MCDAGTESIYLRGGKHHGIEGKNRTIEAESARACDFEMMIKFDICLR